MIYMSGFKAGCPNWIEEYVEDKIKQGGGRILDDWLENGLNGKKPSDILLYDINKFPISIEFYRDRIQRYNLPSKIWGIWTGGSCNHSREEEMYGWKKYYEMGALAACDGIFVGSEYAKEVVTERLLSYIPEGRELSKIICSDGMPLDYGHLHSLTATEKQDTIIIPYTQGRENSVNVAMEVIHALSTWKDFKKYKILFIDKTQQEDMSKINRCNLNNLPNLYPNIKTMENMKREDYLQEMAKAKLVVSVAIDKNFDYEIAEALALGTPVLCPNHSCYPEMLDGHSLMLYDTAEDLLKLIPKMVVKEVHTEVLKNLVRPYDNVVKTWVERMMG